MDNLETALTPNAASDLVGLHEKVDRLTAQVSALSGYLENQQKRQQGFDELLADAIPIGNQVIKITIDELSQIGNDFQLEDLLFLGKRILRDTQLFIKLLDRLEGGMDLLDEVGLLGKQVFDKAVESLDQFEQKGYFNFLRGLNYVADKVVAEFGEEDVIALGDNIVTILTTVRNMTQPEVMQMLNQAVGAIQNETQPENLSAWKLIRELSNPNVRKGMGKMINLLKTLGEQPQIKNL